MVPFVEGKTPCRLLSANSCTDTDNTFYYRPKEIQFKVSLSIFFFFQIILVRFVNVLFKDF